MPFFHSVPKICIFAKKLLHMYTFHLPTRYNRKQLKNPQYYESTVHLLFVKIPSGMTKRKHL